MGGDVRFMTDDPTNPTLLTCAFTVFHSSSRIQGLAFLSIDPCIGIPDIFHNPQLGVMFCIPPTRHLFVRIPAWLLRVYR